MKGVNNLFRQFLCLGSQRKASVSAPDIRVDKPDLAFKVPTVKQGGKFDPARQGGSCNPAVAGSIKFFGFDS